MIPTFIRSYEASADIEGYRIVAFSDVAASKKVAKAATAIGPSIGVSSKLGASAGGMVDVIRDGLGQVQLAGPVNAGDPLASDANGKAIKAVPAAGQQVRVIGYAEEPGIAGDVIDAFIAPSILFQA